MESRGGVVATGGESVEGLAAGVEDVAYLTVSVEGMEGVRVEIINRVMDIRAKRVDCRPNSYRNNSIHLSVCLLCTVSHTTPTNRDTLMCTLPYSTSLPYPSSNTS